MLCAKFTAILDCETPVLDIMARHKSQVVFSPRVFSLQDFVIYNQAHFWGMILIIAYMCDT